MLTDRLLAQPTKLHHTIIDSLSSSRQKGDTEPKQVAKAATKSSGFQWERVSHFRTIGPNHLHL